MRSKKTRTGIKDMMKVNVLLLAPLFPPAAGGAAQYEYFLTRCLSEITAVSRVTVLTERIPDSEGVDCEFRPKVHVSRSLNAFYSLPSRQLKRFPNFAFQNTKLYTFMLAWCRRLKTMNPGVIVIHGAFFIHPSLLARLVSWIRGHYADRVRIILDLRDRSIPVDRLAKLTFADVVISCSQNINQRISRCWLKHPPIAYIPVAVSRAEFSGKCVSEFFKDIGLKPKSYILATNGVDNAKGFPYLYDTWMRLNQDAPGIDLVVVGHVRDWDRKYEQIPTNGARIKVLGPLTNVEVRMLMSKAATVINTSRNEGLPRSCMEAIDVGAPVLVCQNVPEFDDLPRCFIADLDDPDECARQIRYLVERELEVPFDLSLYRPATICGRYEDLISSMISSLGLRQDE